MAGIAKPRAGRVLVAGRTCTGCPPARAVPQFRVGGRPCWSTVTGLVIEVIPPCPPGSRWRAARVQLDGLVPSAAIWWSVLALLRLRRCSMRSSTADWHAVLITAHRTSLGQTNPHVACRIDLPRKLKTYAGRETPAG
nr:hypothetical protein [Actinokineospora spheciospongiae]